MKYAIYHNKELEKELYCGETRYEAWKKFYDAENTFADNVAEFSSMCTSSGYITKSYEDAEK